MAHSVRRLTLPAIALLGLLAAAPAHAGALDADVTPPKIAVTVPVASTVYPIGKDVAAKYKCTDAQSGVATCLGTVLNGLAIDTATVGPKTFTVRTTDVAGNSDRLDVGYTVAYRFTGFGDPITATGAGLNVLPAGDLVKVGFGLAGSYGLGVLAPGYPTSTAIACPAGASHTVASLPAGSPTGLSFTNRYLYGWQTDQRWYGTCRRLTLALNDGTGTEYTADFKFTGATYSRIGAPNYADGISQMVSGPPSRYVSNRIFNDSGQNLFSENGISQWGWTWGQFLDHDFGLRDETPGEPAPIAFSTTDPLESFHNDFGAIDFARTPAAPGTGAGTVRQQVNTITSLIDASGVYGGTDARLDWLREGPLDGNPLNNDARLLLPGGYLPRRDARGDAASAPVMDLFAGQVAAPGRAVVAGDVRANENIALTAVHTLFAREHDRIVAALPDTLTQEQRFQIAKRVVAAEIQYVTYTEFLPDLGVDLPPYAGWSPLASPALSNEFAVVGYRAHSMIHGEFEPSFPAGTFTEAQLDAFEEQGIEVEDEGSTITLVIPLVVAFGNPGLLEQVGLGPLLASLGGEAQYRNDEQIDNSLRSVLFQVPKPGIPDPSVCGSPVINPACYTGVVDLGAIDIERGRDHGMPLYNDLRRAYGLAPKSSFTAITGETTERFPADPLLDAANPVDDPNSLDFVSLADADGNPVPLGSTEGAVTGRRRTTLAARLKAVYARPDRLDAFVGMVSEQHVPGTEFGELQLAMWKQQFQSLRDSDPLFYAIDPQLTTIRLAYGIDYRHTLAELIRLNTGATVQDDVFQAG